MQQSRKTDSLFSSCKYRTVTNVIIVTNVTNYTICNNCDVTRLSVQQRHTDTML